MVNSLFANGWRLKPSPPAPFQLDGGVTPQDAIFDIGYWVLEIKMKSI